MLLQVQQTPRSLAATWKGVLGKGLCFTLPAA